MVVLSLISKADNSGGFIITFILVDYSRLTAQHSAVTTDGPLTKRERD